MHGLRIRRRVAFVAVAGALLALGPGAWAAAPVTIAVSNFQFDPASPRVKMGGEVDWSFQGGMHTATDNTGMALYDSSSRSSGTFAFTFIGAGSYKYHCLNHPDLMFGTIKVPMKVSPRTGPASSLFKITWAAAPATTGFNYDIEVMAPGQSVFSNLLTDQGNPSTTLSLGSAGVWRFRSRMQLGTGAASRYSPVFKVTTT